VEQEGHFLVVGTGIAARIDDEQTELAGVRGLF